MTRTPILGVNSDLAASYRDADLWLNQTHDEYFRAAIAAHPDSVAVIGRRASTPTEEVQLTYAELDVEIDRATRMLDRYGVGVADRVIVQLPNTIEFITSVLAAFRIGAVPVFALPAHGPTEISQFRALTQAVAWLVAPSMVVGQETTIKAVDSNDCAVIDVSAEALADTRQLVPSHRPDAEELAFLQLSGGTTGVPKLIGRTHADYLYSVRESARICGVSHQTVMLVALPASHNFPMSSPGHFAVLGAGGTVVLAHDPRPRTAFDLIERHRVTMSSLVPPLAQAWLAAKRERFDLSSLAVLQVGGARLASSVASDLEADLDLTVQQVFGMAEGLVSYTRLDDPAELRHTTQGRPISELDEIRIVDEAGAPVQPGETGALQTRGPYTIGRYFNDVAPESFTADGFYCTGDLVSQLPSGHLRVEGRAKDQINRAGEKIDIAEVEETLLAFPGVHDAVVVAIPDDELSEASWAVVVGDATCTPEALRRHMRQAGLARFKIPDRFIAVDDFPHTAVGKTSRRDLRVQLAEHLTETTQETP